MIHLHVPAIPVAQPRPRAVIAHGGQGARVHEVTSIKNAATGVRKPHPIVAYKATVALAAQMAYKGPPLEGPLSVVMVFTLPRPGRLCWKTRPMPRCPHVGKPDAENLAKSTLDSLTGTIWRDDSQVFMLKLTKWYAAGGEQPGVEIIVEEINEQNDSDSCP